MIKTPVAVWITDTHLSEKTIEINNSIFAQVLQLCITNDIPLIHGGDIFDSRRAQSEQVLTAFTNILANFSSNQIKIFAIPGNHDRTNLLSADSFLNPFSGWEYFHLHSSYRFIDYPQKQLRFHFIPYFDERLAYREQLDKAIANIRFDYKNLLFTHVGVSGVKNNNGSTVENSLDAGLFKHFSIVLVGHYHDRQIISNNILYTGSAFQASFGEDDKKGATIVYDDGSVEFIPLEFPKYITVEWSKDEDVLKMPLMTEEDKNLYRVKIKFKPTPDRVKQLQEHGYKVIVDYEVEHTDHLQDVKSQFSGQDIVAYFEQFCKEKGISDIEFGLQRIQE